MAFSDADKGMAKRTLKNYCCSWDELRYDEIHNKPYFIGKRLKESATETLFPINCYKAMSFDELKTCIVDSGSTSVNLAVYNSDSTVVLYKAELGLKPPSNLRDESSISVNSSAVDSSKKIKLDDVVKDDVLPSTSVYSDKSETSSNTDLQIDLQSIDSNLSETENDDCEENDTCSGDKSEAIHS